MLLLIALTIFDVVLIVAPLVVALPPVAQTPELLGAARMAQVIAPYASLALAAVLAVQLWRRKTWTAAALMVIALGCVALSRVNLFERVFAPVGDTETAPVADFHDIRDTDMVIGVTIEGQSRAYPVRYLAYHHMVNDRLGATAFLPTY
jgi:Protein of unknown function (DUF3179).